MSKCGAGARPRHSAFRIQPSAFLLRLSPPCRAAIRLMGFHPLAAGADHGFDELAVRVLIPAIDEFGQRLDSIRPLVVSASEIQRAEGVVRGTNHEQTGKTTIELFECVTQRRRLDRREILASAAAKLLTTGGQFMRLTLG